MNAAHGQEHRCFTPSRALNVAGLALLLAAPLVFQACKAPLPASGPVVIYLVDTLRADRVSVYGAPRDTAPAAAALAREGVTFDHAYAISTWTRPSVATMLTSRLPTEVGAINRYGLLDGNVPYLPALFQNAGWMTVTFTCNGNIFDSRLGFSRGFDRFEAIHEPEGHPWAFARNVVDPVIRFLDEQKSPHFFLFVHVVDPHAPVRLEPGYPELFGPGPAVGASDRDSLLLTYDRAVRQADDQFARIVAALRAKGWWNETTAIYTSDHGEEFLEHGGLYHGRTIYEEQVRVPLIIKFPGDVKRGSRRSDPVTLADITPTLADLCGLRRSDAWIGSSLLRSPRNRNRTIYFTEDLDDVRVYGIQRGDEKIIAQLYPVFDRKLLRLDRDPAEKSGIGIGCGQGTPADWAGLFGTLDELRDQELRSYPGTRIEATGRGEGTLEVSARLAPGAKPFLRDSDYCAGAAGLTPDGLVVRCEARGGESLLVAVADDDQGKELPLSLRFLSPSGATPVTLETVGGPVRLVRVNPNFLQGPTVDELVLKNLRSLGYVQ